MHNSAEKIDSRALNNINTHTHSRKLFAWDKNNFRNGCSLVPRFTHHFDRQLAPCVVVVVGRCY